MLPVNLFFLRKPNHLCNLTEDLILILFHPYCIWNYLVLLLFVQIEFEKKKLKRRERVIVFMAFRFSHFFSVVLFLVAFVYPQQASFLCCAFPFPAPSLVP